MRDSNGRAVFVQDDGAYTTEFPESNIVERTTTTETTKYKVYGFVGDHGDFEEQEWEYDDKDNAVEFATELYGSDDVDKFNRDGEVFEVEVHHVDADE